MIASFSHSNQKSRGTQPVVLVDATVAPPPVIELAGGHAQPMNESPDADLGLLRPAPDEINLVVGTLLGLKGSRSVLEELLLPAVEHCRLQAQFFTQVRNWHLVQKMSLQNGHLFLRSVVLAFFPHTFAPL